MKDSIIKLIQSDNYKDRMKGEILELKERIDKLSNMLDKFNAVTLEFTPNTPIHVLKLQYQYMVKYLDILEYRAKLEDNNV